MPEEEQRGKKPIRACVREFFHVLEACAESRGVNSCEYLAECMIGTDAFCRSSLATSAVAATAKPAKTHGTDMSGAHALEPSDGGTAGERMLLNGELPRSTTTAPRAIPATTGMATAARPGCVVSDLHSGAHVHAGVPLQALACATVTCASCSCWMNRSHESCMA